MRAICSIRGLIFSIRAGFHGCLRGQGHSQVRHFLAVAGIVLVANCSSFVYAATVPSAKMLQVVEFEGGFPDQPDYGSYYGTLKFADRLDVEHVWGGLSFAQFS